MSSTNSKVGPVSYFVCSQAVGYSGARVEYAHKTNARALAWDAVATVVSEIDAMPGAYVWVEKRAEGGERVRVWGAAKGSPAWLERLAAHEAAQVEFKAWLAAQRAA